MKLIINVDRENEALLLETIKSLKFVESVKVISGLTQEGMQVLSYSEIL